MAGQPHIPLGYMLTDKEMAIRYFGHSHIPVPDIRSVMGTVILIAVWGTGFREKQ
jgi:hypothetical protein